MVTKSPDACDAVGWPVLDKRQREINDTTSTDLDTTFFMLLTCEAGP
jgi:hypothetical protein